MKDALKNSVGLALLALLTGCASDEALFAEYERPCPVPGLSVPEPTTVVAIARTTEAPGTRILPAVFFDYRSARLDEVGHSREAVVDAEQTRNRERAKRLARSAVSERLIFSTIRNGTRKRASSR